MNIRRWHAWLGLFIAPSVIFFSLTGAVQLFSLHEAHGDYQPPALIEKLSSLHKDQEFALGHHGPARPKADAASPPSMAQVVQPEAGKPGELSKAVLFGSILPLILVLLQATPHRSSDRHRGGVA
jgi:hypothetical protein